MLQYSQTNQLFGGFQANTTLFWFGLIFLFVFAVPRLHFS